MLRKKKFIVISLFILFCVSIGWAEKVETRTVRTRDPKTGKVVEKQLPVTRKKTDPYENTSVLVETFVVEISTDALAEVRVSPIGQVPEGISILKIVACLDDSKEAEVISGSKLMARHNSRSEMSNRDTFYIKQEKVNIKQTPEGPVESKHVFFESYESGVRFETSPNVSENAIRISYEYSDSGVEESDDKTIPPDRFDYDWEGNLSVQNGRPVIAGAVQNEENVVFLILTATIQDSDDVKKN